MKFEYPSDDVVWLARDQAGSWGAFVTAGAAPVPQEICRQPFLLSELEQAILQLPKIAKIKTIITDVPDNSSFKALGERGFYVYDWQDVYRVTAAEVSGYEKVCEPFRSISEIEMKGLLAKFAWPTCRYSFSDL